MFRAKSCRKKTALNPGTRVSLVKVLAKKSDWKKDVPNTPVLRGPNWGLFCPELLAFTGAFFNRFQVRSDRKVLFEQKNGPLMAVNGR